MNCGLGARCASPTSQRGDAERYSIFVLKKNDLAILNRQRIQDAMTITRTSTVSLGHGWVYYIKFWKIFGGQVPAPMASQIEIGAHALDRRRATILKLDIRAGSVRYNPHKKKWIAQIKIKVANDVKACTHALGMWGTEVEAARPLSCVHSLASGSRLACS
jgi:hypothetical protein